MKTRIVGLYGMEGSKEKSQIYIDANKVSFISDCDLKLYPSEIKKDQTFVYIEGFRIRVAGNLEQVRFKLWGML